MKIYNFIVDKLQLFAMIFILALSSSLLSQDAESVLQTTKDVADKIIRETSFDYKIEPLINNLWPYFQTLTSDGGVVVAKASIESKQQMEVILGLSFEGSIAVFINNKKVFSGTSDELQILEYTYSRFNVQEMVPIALEEGANQVTLLCEGGAVKVMMHPINEHNEPHQDVAFLSLVSEPFESKWLISGPYSDSNENELLKIATVDNETNYTENGKFWRVPSMPLVRQLTIPKHSSFQKHPYSEWHYANGGTMLGLLNLYEVSEDERYFEFVKQFTSHVKNNMEKDRWQFEHVPALRGAQFRLFRLVMLDDSGGPALPFVELKKTYDIADYDEILTDVLDQVSNQQDRLPDNTLCRSEPEVNTIWGDDLFMSTPFLCRMALATDNIDLFDDVAHQVIQFNKYLMNPETGLYYHGYYADKGEAAPFEWGRANGWVTWAMSEVLLLMPKDHKNYETIKDIYQNHLASLVKYQNKNGIWHQILTDPSTYEETSCTAMYTLSIARGINNGWIDDNYRKNVLAGWRAIENKIGDDGTVSRICRGTGIGESVAFYNGRQTFDHDPRGLGAVLTAGTEVYRMLTGEK